MKKHKITSNIMPVNYQDTKIYKLVLNSDLDHPIYVGHTAQKYLSDRMTGHRRTFNNWKKDHSKNKLSYFTEELNINDVDIILIESFPCNNVAEARGRELYWINEFKTKQNKPQPITIKGGSTNKKEWKKEYAILNKDAIADKKKQYHVEHSEKIREKSRKYYNDNKEYVKEREKQYAKDNKDKIKERRKQYRIDHAEEIKAKKATKKPCELCGKLITAPHLPRHKRESCPNREIKN